MTWFRVDDGFHDHPKVLDLMGGKHGGSAVALWTLAGAWCSRHLTNGVVPRSQVARLGFRDAHASELVRVRLWELTEGGYVFHQWEEHQPTRDDVEHKKRLNRERQGRHRNALRNALCDSDATRDTVVTDNVTNASSRARSPVPSRPVPTNLPCGESSPAREEPALPEHPSALQSPVGRVRVEFERRFVAKRAVAPGWPQKAVQACAAISGWVEGLPSQEGALARLLDGFFADAWAESHGYPIQALANDPPRYWDPPKPAPDPIPIRRTASVVREELERAGSAYDVEACRRLRLELTELEDAEERRRGYGRR